MMRGNRNTGSKQGKNLRRLATDLLFDTRRKPQAKIVVQRKWLFVLRRLSTIRKFLTVDGTLTRKWDQEHSCQHPKNGTVDLLKYVPTLPFSAFCFERDTRDL